MDLSTTLITLTTLATLTTLTTLTTNSIDIYTNTNINTKSE